MKIRKLVFSNINNLKDGPHVISFDEEPLNSAGIFAIVGPTGAGKSTILDVITLALFNRIPRLPKVSDGSIQKDGSIITHFAKHADAAITYQVGARSFTSKWSIRVASSGKVQPYHMELFDEAGNIISEKSAVPAKNESIIGLNYDQFVKSIILSQGDFSRFLKAKKDERSELLEKLTGSHVYRKVGKAAYDKNKEVRQKLDNQRSLLTEIDVLTEDATKALRIEKEAAANEAIKIEERVKARNTSRRFKMAINSLTQKIALKKQELAKISLELENFKVDQVKLEMHDKVSFLSGDLKMYESAKGNIQKSQSEKESYQNDLLKAKASLQETLKGLNRLTGESVAVGNFKEVMDVYETAVIAFENQLVNLHSRGSDTRSRIKQILAGGTLAFDGQLKPELAIAQLTSVEDNQVQIIGNHLESLDESKLKLKVMAGNLSVLNRLILLNGNLQDAFKDKKSQEQRVVKYEAEKVQNKVLLAKQNALTSTLKDKANLLKKQKVDALKIAKLEDLRDQLIKGEPCPLCGSLDHPYQEHILDSALSSLDTIIHENEQEIKKEEASLRKLENIASEAATGIKIGNQQITETTLKIVGIQENIDLEKQKYQGSSEQLATGIPELMIKLERETKELQQRIEAAGKLVVVRDLLKEFTQLKGIGETYSLVKSEKLSLYDGTDVKRDCNKLQDSFIHASTTIEKLTGFIIEKEKSLSQVKLELTAISKKLEHEMPKVGVHSIGEMAAHILTEDQRLMLSEQKKLLNDNHVAFKAELEQHEKDLKESITCDLIPETILVDLEVLIQNDEITRNNLNAKIGEITSQLKFDAENKKSKEEKQKGIRQLEMESEKWSLLNKMIGSASGDKFANFAQNLTLRNLLVYTNLRLQDLTDRYLLDMPGESGTLTVVDLYQGNTERAVTTLSGGEIFILSLALAISLSDMASQNIALDSLFIDEGFGTLDQETLDVAMSTLEKLQSENKKMVGVISHVEALKERINVQIQLKKNAQGYSKISVVG